MKFFNDIKNSNNSILDIKKLGFEITNTDLPLEVGETKYDPDAETLITRITTNDYLRHGQMEIIRVRNNTGSVIPKGRAVYVTGGIANSPILLIAPVNNNDIMQARRFIGLTTTNISNNSFGKVITSGVIEGLNLPTSEWEVGQCAYVTTNGQYINTPPEKGLITIRVGMVIRVGNNTGSILVFSRFLPTLGMSSDVEIIDPQNGQVLTYDGSRQIWINQAFTVAAENIAYDNSQTNFEPTNVQTVVDQFWIWSQFMKIEVDARDSQATYASSPILEGGSASTEHTTSINSGDSNLKFTIIDGGNPYSSH